MKILLHHRIASRDGQAVHLEELIAALKRQGHETILVGPPASRQTGFGGSSALVDRIKRMHARVALRTAGGRLQSEGVPAAARRRCGRSSPTSIYERFSLFLFAGVGCTACPACRCCWK